MVKKFLVWAFRLVLIPIVVPVIVKSISGKQLYTVMKFVSWPIRMFTNAVPSQNAWDGWKMLYAAASLFILILLLSGIILVITEVAGMPRLSKRALRFINHLLSLVKVLVRDRWSLGPRECDFYWFVSKGKGKGYDYFTNGPFLTQIDMDVVERTFGLRQDYKAEYNIRRDFPGHPSFQFVFASDKATDFSTGVFVFIHKRGVLNTQTEDAFKEIVKPLISIDGSREIVLELTKKKGEVTL